ncbi:MAG: 5-(carboxyamino)imidazole ribonucleotide mutase [bacterium]
MPQVLIVIGSESDRDYFSEVKTYLEHFGLTYQLTVCSAHREPEKLRTLLANAEREGSEVIIAGAGMAAHLAGACAAQTILPVIGVPLPGSSLNGLDALLATVQMPKGVPVATVALGQAGAVNAAILAAQIIARKSEAVVEKLRTFKRQGCRL